MFSLVWNCLLPLDLLFYVLVNLVHRTACCLRQFGGRLHLGNAAECFQSHICSSRSLIDMTLFFFSSKKILGHLTVCVAKNFTISLITPCGVPGNSFYSLQSMDYAVSCAEYPE